MSLPISNIGYHGVGSDGRAITEYFSWNAIGMGCSNIANCPTCYARRFSRRQKCPQCRAFVPHFHAERLGQPRPHQEPAVVLNNFWGDTCDRARPVEQIVSMQAMALSCPQHVYVWLTRRPAAFMSVWRRQRRHPGPLPANWHLGTTIRTQAMADAVLPEFLSIPGNLWISAEPLIERVDLHLSPVCAKCGGAGWLWGRELDNPDAATLADTMTRYACDSCDGRTPPIRGVIIGQDSVAGAPGTETLDHVCDLARQCREAEVRCFVKQIWDSRGHSPILVDKPAGMPADLRLCDLPWPAAGKEKEDGKA